MADESKGVLARLLTETWPARTANSVLQALMLPGQVSNGVLRPQPDIPGQWSDIDEARSQATQNTMTQRASDLGGLLMFGGYGQAPAGAVGMAGSRLRGLPSSSSLATPPAPTAADMLRLSRIEDVPLSQARSTQPKMDWRAFDEGKHPEPLLKGYADKPVAVRREDGEYLIFDGHHRSAQAIGDGKQSLNMYVINAKDYAPEFAGRKPAPVSATDHETLLRSLMGDN